MNDSETKRVRVSMVYPADATPGHLLSVVPTSQLALLNRRKQKKNVEPITPTDEVDQKPAALKPFNPIVQPSHTRPVLIPPPAMHQRPSPAIGWPRLPPPRVNQLPLVNPSVRNLP